MDLEENENNETLSQIETYNSNANNQNDISTKDILGTIVPMRGAEKGEPNYTKGVVYGLLGVILGAIFGYFITSGFLGFSPILGAILFGTVFGALFFYMGTRAVKAANKFEKIIAPILLVIFLLGVGYIFSRQYLSFYFTKRTIRDASTNYEEIKDKQTVSIEDARAINETVNYKGISVKLVKVDKESGIATLEINPSEPLTMYNVLSSGQKSTFYGVDIYKSIIFDNSVRILEPEVDSTTNQVVLPADTVSTIEVQYLPLSKDEQFYLIFDPSAVEAKKIMDNIEETVTQNISDEIVTEKINLPNWKLQ